VKSNIGHCEAAAGIAGLTKLLLQLQHGVLVPSIHCEPLNPKIDFESARVRVQRELAPWQAQVRDGVTVPRVAGLSSFGAGGSNAHVVIEEYAAPHRPPAAATDVLVPVSARTKEALVERVRGLASHLDDLRHDIDPACALERIAYTLQVGREAMKYRVAWVVRDLAELRVALERFDVTDAVRSDDDAARAASTREPRDLKALAAEWCSGRPVDWASLWQGREPDRASLPTYPFARRRYWVPEGEPVEARDRYEDVVDELISDRISIDQAAHQILARGVS
jgi:acyl transferase domain-containing protein